MLLSSTLNILKKKHTDKILHLPRKAQQKIIKRKLKISKLISSFPYRDESFIHYSSDGRMKTFEC